MSGNSTLSAVLQNPEQFPWSESLFLPKDGNWSLASPCIVWDADDVDGSHEVPDLARQQQMEYVLSISTIQEIVENARQQKRDCSLDDLLDAFLFYHRHDAFMVIE